MLKVECWLIFAYRAILCVALTYFTIFLKLKKKNTYYTTTLKKESKVSSKYRRGIIGVSDELYNRLQRYKKRHEISKYVEINFDVFVKVV